MDNTSDPENRNLVSRLLNRPFDWQKWLVTTLVLAAATVGSLYLQQTGKDTKNIYVPNHDLPAYHLIQETDLITKTLSVVDLSEDVLIAKEDMIDHYTLEMLGSDEVVIKSQVISIPSLDLVKDTTAIPIPATAAMIFNGKLSSGTVVTVWAIYPTNEPGVSKTELLLQRVLVLDVQKTESGVETESHPYVAILAVPIDRQAKVITAAYSGSLTFTLTP